MPTYGFGFKAVPEDEARFGAVKPHDRQTFSEWSGVGQSSRGGLSVQSSQHRGQHKRGPSSPSPRHNPEHGVYPQRSVFPEEGPGVRGLAVAVPGPAHPFHSEIHTTMSSAQCLSLVQRDAQDQIRFLIEPTFIVLL